MAKAAGKLVIEAKQFIAITEQMRHSRPTRRYSVGRPAHCEDLKSTLPVDIRAVIEDACRRLHFVIRSAAYTAEKISPLLPPALEGRSAGATVAKHGRRRTLAQTSGSPA